MSNNIMSIREMIHSSFGESKNNVVNFKLVQAVLYLLARHLRVLERRVEVREAILDSNATSSKLSVTEVKINATVSKKKRKVSQELVHKTLEKSSTSTKPQTYTDEDHTDESSAHKSSTQKRSSLIQSLSYDDEKSKHNRTNFLPTSDKIMPVDNSDDLGSTIDTTNKFSSSKPSDKSILGIFPKDSVENKMHGNILAKAGEEYAKSITQKKKLSLREDPRSSPYFTKIVQYSRKVKINKEHHVDNTMRTISKLEPVNTSKKDTAMSFKFPQKTEPKSENIYNTETSKNLTLSVRVKDMTNDEVNPTVGIGILSVEKERSLDNEPVPSPYFIKEDIKGLKEPENLSMYDVLQQFHSFKTSLSFKKLSIDETTVNQKNFSLPSLQDVKDVAGEARTLKEENFSSHKSSIPKLYEEATMTDVTERTQLTDDVNKKKKPAKDTIEIISFKLPTIDSSHSFNVSLNGEDDKVESTFHKLLEDPVSMPYFTMAPTSQVNTAKTMKTSTEKTPKFTSATTPKDTVIKVKSEEFAKVTFDENYEVYPKSISFQKVEGHSQNVNQQSSKKQFMKLPEEKESHLKNKELQFIEDPISKPYFTKTKTSEVIHSKNKNFKVKSGKSSIDKTGKATTENTSAELLHMVESKEILLKYSAKRRSVFEDVETKSNSKKDIADTPTKKNSLSEEVVAIARKLSIHEDVQRTDAIENESNIYLTGDEFTKKQRSIGQETEDNIILQDDLFLHTSLTSLRSALKSSSSGSTLSLKDIEVSNIEHIQAKSSEISQNSAHGDDKRASESPLHSDQSFVVRPAGPYGKPLPKEGEKRILRYHKHKRQFTHSINQKKQKEHKTDFYKKEPYQPDSYMSIEYETEAYGEVKEDGGYSDTSAVQIKKAVFKSWSEAEMLREKELRVINQRADSHEEPDVEPMPMAIAPSTEIQQERLLIMERKYSTEGTEKREDHSQGRTPQLSIVTKEEFQKLQAEFINLRDQFTDTHQFPENAELMNQLRQWASFSDAMSALKLSARLEAVEKSVEFLSGVVTEICKGEDIDVNAQMTSDIKVYTGDRKDLKDTRDELEKYVGDASKVQKEIESRKPRIFQYRKSKKDEFASEEEEEPGMIDRGVSVLFEPKTRGPYSLEDDQFVTFKELGKAMQNLETQMMKTVRLLQKHSDEYSKKALQTSQKLEGQLENALNLENRMDELYEMVSKYSSRITDIDMGISAQMSSYQDQLTQMQFDLESTIESVAEAIASSGADPELIKELRNKLAQLDQSLEKSLSDQKEIQQILHSFGLDLGDLWKQIENLRATKCDHEELEDGLHDKVDICTINGLVRQDQFDACVEEFHGKMQTVYTKIDAQEHEWQQAIEDLVAEMNEKAHFTQLTDLRDHIHTQIEKILAKIKHLTSIVGQAPAGAVSRQLLRDTNCLSCQTPALLNMDKSSIPILPTLRRPRTIGAEAVAEGADGLCYPGKPIPHPIDPRAKLCRRYCGGHVTGERHQLTRMDVKRLGRDQTTRVGTDGKVYVVDESLVKPCHPCNYAMVEPEMSHGQDEQRSAPKENTSIASATSDDWNSCELIGKMCINSVSNTLPLYEDNDDDDA